MVFEFVGGEVMVLTNRQKSSLFDFFFFDCCFFVVWVLLF